MIEEGPLQEAETQHEKQPNSKHCFVCGVENDNGLKMTFYTVGDGIVEAEYVVPERFQGYPGVVHGGIIASMLVPSSERGGGTNLRLLLRTGP